MFTTYVASILRSVISARLLRQTKLCAQCEKQYAVLDEHLQYARSAHRALNTQVLNSLRDGEEEEHDLVCEIDDPVEERPAGSHDEYALRPTTGNALRWHSVGDAYVDPRRGMRFCWKA